MGRSGEESQEALDCRTNRDLSKAINTERPQPPRLLLMQDLCISYTLEHMLMLVGLFPCVW